MGLTVREREFLELIRKEPLISQDELANRFNISRSSVAVHISNLMRKGYILGKGYVVSKQVSMVVFGETGLLINIMDNQSNPKIDLQYGGISQQISQVLSRFGVNVKLITILGNDEVGSIIVRELQENLVDTGSVYRDNEKRTCRKIIVNDQVAYREGFPLEEYNKVLEARLWTISSCEWFIVEEQFHQLVALQPKENTPMPMACTYKLIKYPQEIPDYLASYNVLVLGLENSQYLDYYSNRLAELGSGIVNGIVTDGVSRVLCSSRDGFNDFLLAPNQHFDVKEKLPLFVAGMIYGLSMGQPMRQAVRIGTGTAI